MMKQTDYNSQIVSIDELKKYSRYFAEKFLKKAICCQSLISDIVDFSFYSTEAAYRAEPKLRKADPIFLEKQEIGCKIHLCEECLQGIPSLALQGWLEQELAFCRQNSREELYCNFREYILPIFPVLGLAENFIRELVHYLDKALRCYLTTEKILDFGFGLHQVHFYFFKVNFSEELKERYQEFIPYYWTRSHILSKRLPELMPISLLARRNIMFSDDLEKTWWKYHDYLLPEDKTLLKEIVAIPELHVNESFCFKLVETFKKVKRYLLEPKVENISSAMIH